MEESPMQLQFEISLLTIFVMIYPINFKIGQTYLKILQIRIMIMAYIFFPNY